MALVQFFGPRTRQQLQLVLLYLVTFPGAGFISLVGLSLAGQGKSLSNLALEPVISWVTGASAAAISLLFSKFRPLWKARLALAAAGLAVATSLALYFGLPGLPE